MTHFAQNAFLGASNGPKIHSLTLPQDNAIDIMRSTNDLEGYTKTGRFGVDTTRLARVSVYKAAKLTAELSKVSFS